MIKLKNTEETSRETILGQLSEPRPLPMGRKDFEDWSDRIISGAVLPGATAESQKFALAGMLTHIGPTESHKPDAHFVHSLRVCAIKQVAIDIIRELNEAKKARETTEVTEK